MNTVQINSLEIFKQNKYSHADIGMVSDNAYLSIVATNNCQCKCAYCINSETDHRLNLPISKAVYNIRKLIHKYGVKEAIILGGEPLLHPNLLQLIRDLRESTDLKMVRLTTNGITPFHVGKPQCLIPSNSPRHNPTILLLHLNNKRLHNQHNNKCLVGSKKMICHFS